MKKAFALLLATLMISACKPKEVEISTSSEQESSLVSLSSTSSKENTSHSGEQSQSSSKKGNEGGSDIPWIH